MKKFIIGDDMLFLHNDSNNVTNKYDRNLVNYNILNRHIESIKNIINKDIKIIIITVPDKIEIYPEKLKKPLKKSFSDLIYVHMQKNLEKNENVYVFNLKEFLLNNRTTTNLYWNLDTHYTYETTFIIFMELINKINENKIFISRDKIFDKKKKSQCCDLLNMEYGKKMYDELHVLFNKHVYKNKHEEAVMVNHDFNNWVINYFKSQKGIVFLKKYNIYDQNMIEILNNNGGDTNTNYIINKIDYVKNIHIGGDFEKIYSFGKIINKPYYMDGVNIVNKFKDYCCNFFVYTKLKNEYTNCIEKKILFVGDSYASMGLIHMFSLYVREFYFVFSANINFNFVNELNPDIFIFEKASRFI